MASRGLTRAVSRPRLNRALALAAFALGLPFAAPQIALAAAPPQLGAAWTTEVSAASVTFHGEVNPEGESTTYRFEYLTDAAYQANLTANPSREGFFGAARAPVSPSCPGTAAAGCAGQGSSFATVSQHASALRSATLYHYRLSATNAEGTETLETNSAGSPLTFATQEPGAAFALPDTRGWELVSPPEKNGGAIQAPGQIHGGGVIQAAPSGAGKITYSSASSFGGYEAKGAPPASQYISSRTGSGWATQNITAPTVSGAYGSEPNGVPYQLFSQTWPAP